MTSEKVPEAGFSRNTQHLIEPLQPRPQSGAICWTGVGQHLKESQAPFPPEFLNSPSCPLYGSGFPRTRALERLYHQGWIAQPLIYLDSSDPLLQSAFCLPTPAHLFNHHSTFLLFKLHLSAGFPRRPEHPSPSSSLQGIWFQVLPIPHLYSPRGCFTCSAHVLTFPWVPLFVYSTRVSSQGQAPLARPRLCPATCPSPVHYPHLTVFLGTIF